ncbi:ABC transporter permease [Myxococcaceae bacterium JPH2]|nr:ABC transporter permease [Myxococcaceae bacterium JPH2]
MRASTERQTGYRWTYLWLGAVVALVGFVLLGVALASAQSWGEASPALGLSLVGWGSLVQVLSAALLTSQQEVTPASTSGVLLAGTAVWLAGWGIIAAGIRRLPESPGGPSPAAGATLYPRLARYRDFYWRTLAAYGGGFLLAEVVLILLQKGLSGGVLSLTPTGAFVIALLVSGMVTFLAGFLGASRAQRLSWPEATLGALYLGLPIPIVLSMLGYSSELQLTLGSHLRELTQVAEALSRPELGYGLVFTFLVLALVLGISTGFIATGSGRIDLRMGFELFVARRHVAVFRPSLLLGTLAVLMLGIIPPLLIYFILRSTEAAVERTRIRELGLMDPLAAASDLNRLKNQAQSPTMMMTALSVGGVGVGVMALIIVLSVMSGFETELRQKILGTNAHAVLSKYSGGLTEYPQLMDTVRKVPGVVGQTPFLINQVMIASEHNVDGVIIKGIDPTTVGDVTDLPRNIQGRGSVDLLNTPEKIVHRGPADEAPAEGNSTPAQPGIIIGRELAASLRVAEGDSVTVISPLGSGMGPTGPSPKSRAFRVAAIFYSGMYEYDSKFVYILLTEAQDFFAVEGATGIELKVADIDDARRTADQVVKTLGGYPYRARDWGAMNKNFFSALRLQKLVMGIILTIIIIVAAGLIVATVIMMVLEKRKEIAVLKALGVPDGGIVKIFLAEGLQIGVAGGLLGLMSGLSWCLFIEKVGIKMDAAVYYMSTLPVRIEPVQTVLAVVIAVLVTYLASIYPALKASSVEPVEGLKAE